jgi:TPR repeat protein
MFDCSKPHRRFKKSLQAIGAAAILSCVWALPSSAGMDEAMAAYQAKDYSLALQEFSVLAKTGDAKAEYYMGRFYHYGEGVTVSGAEAAKWYRKAADKGVTGAQYNLGILYDQGNGVKEDAAEAARWFRKAADLNDPQAQFSLAYFYQMGRGVKQDPGEAFKWYKRSADQGHAISYLAMGFSTRDGSGVAANKVEALKWFELASAALQEGMMRDVASRARDRIQAKMNATEIAQAEKLVAAWKSEPKQVQQ